MGRFGQSDIPSGLRRASALAVGRRVRLVEEGYHGSMTRAERPSGCWIFAASLRAKSVNAQLARLAASVAEEKGATADYALISHFSCPSVRRRLRVGRGDPARRTPPARAAARSRRLPHRLPRVQRVDAGRAQEHDRLGVALPAPAVQRPAGAVDVRVALHGRRKTAGSGRCASRWNISVRGYIPTCSRSRRRTRHSGRTSAWSTRGSNSSSRARSTASSTWSKPPSTYPALKKQWVEFLGEQPTAVTNRVESTKVTAE